MEKRQFPLISGAGKTGELHITERFLTPYTKINSQWIKELKVRLDTIKILEESIGRTLLDINFSKIFFNPLARVLKIKAKLNKWGLIKIESFCTAMETISKMKRRPSEWRKIHANRSNRQEINLQSTQTAHGAYHQKNKQANKKTIKQWVEDLNRHFFKADIQMAKMHLKDAPHH